MSSQHNQPIEAIDSARKAESPSQVKDQIAMHVMKEAKNQQENLIQTLVVNAPKIVPPKSMMSTFEMIM